MSRVKCLVVVIFAATTVSTEAQDVAYEKYQLPNGMTVILHEDHTMPAACVNTWYYVSSWLQMSFHRCQPS